MELLWTAFLLGLVGSLHCAVMCGPLQAAIGNTGIKSLVYNFGRIFTYCLLGLIFALAGKTFALVGLQRWLSLAAGAAILLGLLCANRYGLKTPVAKLVLRLKSAFAFLLQDRTAGSQFFLGILNGLLPCGLVYIAAAGAAATMSPSLGILHMATFGIGTLPMMLGLGIASGHLRRVAFRFQKLMPVCAVFVAMLLVLRGMALGIPYVSPSITECVPASCH